MTLPFLVVVLGTAATPLGQTGADEVTQILHVRPPCSIKRVGSNAWAPLAASYSAQYHVQPGDHIKCSGRGSVLYQHGAMSEIETDVTVLPLARGHGADRYMLAPGFLSAARLGTKSWLHGAKPMRPVAHSALNDANVQAMLKRINTTRPSFGRTSGEFNASLDRMATRGLSGGSSMRAGSLGRLDLPADELTRGAEIAAKQQTYGELWKVDELSGVASRPSLAAGAIETGTSFAKHVGEISVLIFLGSLLLGIFGSHPWVWIVLAVGALVIVLSRRA